MTPKTFIGLAALTIATTVGAAVAVMNQPTQDRLSMSTSRRSRTFAPGRMRSPR